jgi:hypothetical protein
MDDVRLAERATGSIPRKVALRVFEARRLNSSPARPDARIINLETAVTRSEDFAPKGII